MLSVKRAVVLLVCVLPTSALIRHNVVNQKTLGANPPEVDKMIKQVHTSTKKKNVAKSMKFLAQELPQFRKMLQDKKRFVMVKDYDEFAKAYLKENDASVTPEAVKTRKKILMDNQNTGMTATSGVIYVMENAGGEHDGIHEIIHLLNGGPQAQFKQNSNDFLNEGFTEYYTKDLVSRLKASDTKAYEKEYNCVVRLEKAVGKKVLLDSFWNKGNIDGIAKWIAKRWMKRVKTLKNNQMYYTAQKKLKHSWIWLVPKNLKEAETFAKTQLLEWNPNAKKDKNMKFWEHAVDM
jgi:hypothetical protein